MHKYQGMILLWKNEISLNLWMLRVPLEVHKKQFGDGFVILKENESLLT